MTGEVTRVTSHMADITPAVSDPRRLTEFGVAHAPCDLVRRLIPGSRRVVGERLGAPGARRNRRGAAPLPPLPPAAPRRHRAGGRPEDDVTDVHQLVHRSRQGGPFAYGAVGPSRHVRHRLGSTHGQSDAHLHPYRRPGHDRPRRHEPHRQDRSADRRVRRRQRGQRGDRHGDRAGRPAGGGREVLVRVQNDLFDVGADLCHPGRGEPGVPAAAGRAVLHRQAGGGLRPLQLERAGEAAQLHPPRRHPGRGAAAPGLHGRTPRRALDVGGAGGARRRR